MIQKQEATEELVIYSKTSINILEGKRKYKQKRCKKYRRLKIDQER